MTYQVLDAVTGIYNAAETVEEAKTLLTELVNKYCDYHAIGNGITIDNPDPESKSIANEFCAIRFGISDVNYAYSVFNVDTQKLISRVYVASDESTKYLVKVANSSITELYISNAECNGATRFYVALDLDTEQPIEYYDLVDGIVTKYSLTGEPLVTTISCSFNQLPEDKQILLGNFSAKNKINSYSQKSYGFCIEFSEMRFIPYAECTEQEKSELDVKRSNYIKTTDRFSVNKEVKHGNGDVTWVPVDILTW